MAAVLAVRVHQWSARSYLEDQDMWWLSGLFRSVTLLARPPGAIDDVFVHADYYHTSGAGTLRVDTDVPAHLGEVHGELVRERHVLGVAALDVRPELREAIPEQASVVVVLRGLLTRLTGSRCTSN
jgi:beta-galactosidase/beta-glucuronidase